MYDDEGFLTRSELDSDVDGDPDHWSTYRYSDDGALLVRDDYDTDRGHVTRLRYVMSEELLVAIQYAPVADAELVPDFTEFFVYDEHGRLARIEFRANDSNEVLSGERYEYHVDRPWVKTIMVHYSPDHVEWVVNLDYDSIGRLLRQLNGDAVFPDAVTQYRYYCDTE